MATTKAELYNNGILVGTKTSAPFNTFDWIPASGEVGAASLTVKRYEDGVLAHTTSAVSGTVTSAGITIVANYPMTETTGNMIDTVSGNNGTIFGSISRDGTKYTFDGVDDYIEIEDNEAHTFVNGGGDMSFEIEMKIKFDNLTGLKIIASKRDVTDTVNYSLQEWQIWYDNTGGALMLSLYQNGKHTLGSIDRGIPSNQLTVGTEQTIKFIYDGSKTRAGITASINGTPVSTYTDGGSASYTGMINTTAKTMIGKINNGTVNYLFAGTIRDIKISKI